MRRLSFLLLLPFTLALALQVHANAPAPYLYYYSDVLNGFVIERADGTDSRLLGKGIAQENMSRVTGPGWSPDGKRFAWITYALSDGGPVPMRGHILNTLTGEPVKLLDAFSNVYAMWWSPERDLLLVAGNSVTCPGCTHILYLLLDVQANRYLASFTTTTLCLQDVCGSPEWHEGYVTFPIDDNLIGRTYSVSLYFDGRIRQDEIEETTLTPLIRGSVSLPERLNSSSGRYTHKPFDATLVDTQSKRKILLPAHSDAVEPILEARWHPSEEWVLLGYNQNSTEYYLTGGVTVFNPVTGYQRELGSCGFEVACVDWLPVQVDVISLAAGSPGSVLPAPVKADYTVEPTLTGMSTVVLVCGENGKYQNEVRDKATQQQIFVLTHSTKPCYGPDYQEPFPFAISPDRHIYAATDAATGLTALFDSTTDERLALLNVRAYQLVFSADGKLLTTRANYALLTWDVDALLGNRNP
jgi:hypothetical protein